MTRGRVIALTPDQVRARALFLAGELKRSALDQHVGQGPELCPVLTYSMTPGHNGGTSPTASDPASRWAQDGKGYATADCIGGASWCGGWDRYQPKRFEHLYGGWINTDSMHMDASGTAKCFISLGRPEPGAYVVCKSGSRGHRIGHIGTVVGYRLAEWEPSDRACWDAIEVVDVAGRSGRANLRTTGRGWFNTGALFARSIMEP